MFVNVCVCLCVCAKIAERAARVNPAVVTGPWDSEVVAVEPPAAPPVAHSLFDIFPQC